MLTIQTYKLLKTLKSMNNPVIESIDKHNNLIKIYDETDASNIYLGYPIPPKDKNLINTFRWDEYKYLLENHYIVIYEGPFISFTHLGYRLKQITIMNIIWHLIFSIIIPFIVAYLTSR